MGEIVGVSEGSTSGLIQAGKIRRLQMKAQPNYARNGNIYAKGVAPFGNVSMLLLDDCIRWANSRQKRTIWTEQMDEYLLEKVGVESRDDIARHFNVTMPAVSGRCMRLGINKFTNTGLLTTGRAAKIIGRAAGRLQDWHKRGIKGDILPTHQVGVTHFIDPLDLYKWLQTKPTVLKKIEPQRMERLKLMAYPLAAKTRTPKRQMQEAQT